MMLNFIKIIVIHLWEIDGDVEINLIAIAIVIDPFCSRSGWIYSVFALLVLFAWLIVVCLIDDLDFFEKSIKEH